MAEVLIKTNLVSSRNVRKQQIHHRRATVPKTFNFSSGASFTVKRFPSLKLESHVHRSLSFSYEFHGKNPVFRMTKGIPKNGKSLFRALTTSQMSPIFGKAQKWWEKGLQPNMREVSSAQDLVDSLVNAGDKLVVLDFFSPGCGGCRALHPKICQLAEMNTDVQFLQIKKFKDALAKHTPDRCNLGPTKGLEEKELLALSANKVLSFTYTPKPDQPEHSLEQEELADVEPSPLSSESLPLPPITPNSSEVSKERTLIIAGR